MLYCSRRILLMPMPVIALEPRPHPICPVRSPVRRHVERPATALRHTNRPAPADRRERRFIRQPEGGEGEGRRVQASRVRARDEEAFEAMAFQVRDGRRFYVGHFALMF